MAIRVVDRRRVPAGVPTGGRFAAEVRMESGITLDEYRVDSQPSAWDAVTERREADGIRALLAEALEAEGRMTSPDADGAGQAAALAELDRRVQALGERVADEAERRAGVSGEELGRRSAEITARIEAEFKELLARPTNGLPVSESREVFARLNELGRRRADISAGTGPDIGDDLARLSDSYREVLSEIRPMGGSVDYFYDGPNAKVLGDHVEKVMACFPADWVAKSNSDAADTRLNLEPIGRDRRARGRAYYAHRTTRYVRRRERSYRVKLQPADWTPADGPDGGDVVPDGNAFQVRGHDGNPQWFRRWKTPAWHHAYGETPPRGKDWEPDPESPGRWRQPAYRMTDRSDGEVAQLRVHDPKDPTAFGSMVHEFSHRFERTVPGITLLEREHKRARTTDSDGERRREPYMRGTREVVYAGDFADRYMGKEYSGKYVGDAHEVLSCATQALMGHQLGGLVGTGGYRSDPKSRAFALGLLASV
jgi:hypothetical protein